MFDHAELDLSRVYVHDGYLLKDVTTVGRHKAIGTLAFSPSPSDRFRTPDIDLRQIGETLESRGMRVFLDGPPAGRGHQQEIADLVRQLPQVRYDRKLKPGYFFLGKNTDLPYMLIAADPVTIERLLAVNREALYGFPPTVEAFVDLIRSVWIDLKLPLGKLIQHAKLTHFPSRTSTEGQLLVLIWSKWCDLFARPTHPRGLSSKLRKYLACRAYYSNEFNPTLANRLYPTCDIKSFYQFPIWPLLPSCSPLLLQGSV